LSEYYVSILILLGIEPNKIKCYPAPTLEDGRIPHREVKNSKLIPFKYSGHGSFYDQKDKFNEELVKFIEE